ncbi:hypothetical protein RJ639_040274 [Escallonia herrerae]|uniref:TF-B3 domain-containing protein n=1 Tax=Escallonia herrerae TaxID=1293975 RepID=A0AA88WHR3_9ASTE|nr:hypothetical protein RJ639_040274 [Escallonia herrerae]
MVITVAIEESETAWLSNGRGRRGGGYFSDNRAMGAGVGGYRGWGSELRIPKAFFNYIRGENLEQAMLRRGDQTWPVKINDGLFENGWTEFARDNKVEEGYFLVFRHEGRMVFDVMIFEPSSYEKEYQIPEAPCNPREAKETTPALSTEECKFNGSNEYQKGKDMMSHGEAKATSSSLRHHPYFLSTVTPDSFNRRRCEIILMFENQTSWPATLRYKGSNSLIGRGCREFFIGNGIKEGEPFKLELIRNGKKPILNFSRLKKMTVRTCNQRKAINNSTPDRHLSYFKSTLTQYNITKSVLYLPNKFTRMNGLSNGVMILRDEKKRSWPVEIRDAGNIVAWTFTELRRRVIFAFFLHIEVLRLRRKDEATLAKLRVTQRVFFSKGSAPLSFSMCSRSKQEISKENFEKLKLT